MKRVITNLENIKYNTDTTIQYYELPTTNFSAIFNNSFPNQFKYNNEKIK